MENPSLLFPERENIALSDQTDLELVDASLREAEIFGVLMERYEAPLKRYLLRLTGWGEEEIQDILQETFIKAYRNLNDFDRSLKFSSWLYRIAHNQTIDVFRYEAARPTANRFPIEDTARFIPALSDPEEETASRWDMEEVREALERLPLKYREVLILRFLEEKDYDEIMDILKKPKGTVATLIKRGRVLLLKEMKQ